MLLGGADGDSTEIIWSPVPADVGAAVFGFISVEKLPIGEYSSGEVIGDSARRRK